MNPQPLPLAIPPLENGDRLTRPKFERRYNRMPCLKKAELIATLQLGLSSSEHQAFKQRLTS